jgi:hypothetical protein
MLVLPQEYLALVYHATQSATSDENRYWVGEAGFFLPDRSQAMERWTDALLNKRWPWMNPELVPFADDGAGNQFCFHVRAGSEPRITAIVYWSYETYRALPVASDFGCFLDWLFVVAHTMARSLNLSPLDMDHYEDVLVPLAERLRRSSVRRLDSLYRSTHSVHRQIVELNPRCPASQLIVGMQEVTSGNVESGSEHLHRAALEFPEFCTAYMAESEALEAVLNAPQQLALWARCLRSPLAFAGDPQLTQFGDVPVYEPVWLFEKLAACAQFVDQPFPLPVFEMVATDPPASADTWLRSAIDCANEGDVDLGITFAHNASLYLMNTGAEHHSFLLLQEFYECNDWGWHVDVVERELAMRGDQTIFSDRR